MRFAAQKEALGRTLFLEIF